MRMASAWITMSPMSTRKREPKREEVLYLRMTEPHKELLRKVAKRRGLFLGDWARMVLLEAAQKEFLS